VDGKGLREGWVVSKGARRRVNNRTLEKPNPKGAPPPKSKAQITIRPQVPIDGEDCAEYCSRNSCLSSNVGLAKKGTLLPMRFLSRFGLFLVFTATLGLFCSAFAELLTLEDDTTNDFVTSTPAQNIENVQTVREESSPRRSTPQRVTYLSISVICFTQPALPSGLDLLRLLSIQRK
jgi:hypothetical protein